MGTYGHPTPRPFLKWLGGKRQLLTELLEAVRAVGTFRHYFEPFLGGGALFFALARMGYLLNRANLSDRNPNLIDAYTGVRDHVDEVVDILTYHQLRHSEEHYYTVRANVPRDLPNRAARIIYLNKTCFNGLYRENSRGQFNVPMGRYKNPRICDEANLRAVSHSLRSTHISIRNFDEATYLAKAGDLVYFDPPYLPISSTSHFSSYFRLGFNLTDHEALVETCRILARKGVHVIVSNSYTEETCKMYDDFFIYEVFANRLVNSKASKRGRIPEALMTSFPIGLDAAVRSRNRYTPVLINSLERRGLETMLARQWLRENNYDDVADLIDEVVNEWKAGGKQTRRNWWEILAGDSKGEPRVVAGRKFPILRAAQLRQGVTPTEDAICRNPNEEIPTIRLTKRWTEKRNPAG